MDERVYIKKEPQWCGEEGEAPLPGDDNEPRVDAAGRGGLGGVDQISQSSYSAAVNLAHGAARVKEERQVATTDVDFDRIIPQFVCAPDMDPLGAPALPPAASCREDPPPGCRRVKWELPTLESTSMEVGESSYQADHGALSSLTWGSFVFCPVIGMPAHDKDFQQEPGESGCDKITTDKTLVFVNGSSEVQGEATKDEASSQLLSQAGPSRVHRVTDRDEHTCDTFGEKLGSRSLLTRHACLHGSGNKDGYVQFDVGRAEQCDLFDRVKIHDTVEPSSVDLCEKLSIPSPVLSTPHKVQSVANSNNNEANVYVSLGTDKQQIAHRVQTLYNCDVCNAKFTKHSRLTRHERTHAMPFACDVCEARFTSSPQLVSHNNNTHPGIKPYACNVCEARYTTQANLIIHIRSHTGEKPFVCDICKARFTFSSQLVRHNTSTHPGKKPFACDNCEARFTSSSSLIRHARCHTGDRPFACGVCTARFSQSSVLITHMRSHTGEKPFACDKCEARFSKQFNLIGHIRSHTGEKPFACDKCEARFTKQFNLVRHLRSHSGDKPYVCDVCGSRYYTQERLAMHIRSHSVEKLFACDKCEARFVTKHKLAIHVRSHTGEKPFSCDQ